MNTAKVRAQLIELASGVKLPKDATVHAGSRKIDFEDVGPATWEFGVAVLLARDYDDAIDDYDPLLAGPNSIKRAIEEDRTLGGLVMDTKVVRIIGPVKAPGNHTLTEWVVHILQEEE